MYIINDGIRLNAQLDMPDKNVSKCPVAVIIHGFTGHMEERHIVSVAQAIRALGCATLRVDMYGHGHSDGTFREHTLYKWLTNALCVIDYARALDFATDIYLCGHSQGGLTAVLAAALKHDQISALIPMSPALMIPQLARDGELLGLSFDPDHIPDDLKSWDGRLLSGNYARVAQTIDVDKAIDRYQGPVLIVHGDADEVVPIRCIQDAAARYTHCDLKLIPGDTHCYDHHLDQATAAVSDWLRPLVSKA